MTPLSRPFTLYFNIDKPMLIFALLILVPNILSNNEYNWRDISLSFTQKIIIGGGLITLPLLAWALQLVKPELTLPSWWWIFAINNLIFTCVAEEVLFRGYIQGFLCKKLSAPIAIIIASILFGLVHFAGSYTIYHNCDTSWRTLWFKLLLDEEDNGRYRGSFCI